MHAFQVHPDDDQAQRMNGVRGVLADPRCRTWGAYGIGLTQPVCREQLKEAALDGSVIDLID